MHVLFYGESPVVTTGLGLVSKHIVDALQEDGHKVTIIPTNHNMVVEYDNVLYPYNIISPGDDAYAFESIKQYVKRGDYDILFVSTDFGRDADVYSELINDKKRLVVGYYAIDCDQLTPQTFNTFSFCNAKIVCTEHGKRVVEGYRPDMVGLVNVINNPCEPDVFFPMGKEEKKIARREIFNITDDDMFLVMNLNRNQPRKDLGRTLAVFHQFHTLYPNSRLYMHAQQNDVGGHLPSMAYTLGMNIGTEVIFSPPDFNVVKGYTRQFLNRLYNASDCLFSSSYGEGWGLSTTEAMASGTPVVVPNNTAFTEIVGENEERGYLIKSGGDIDHTQWTYGTSCQPRSIIHSTSAIAKLTHVYLMRKEALEKAKLARQWTIDHDLQSFKNKWKVFFRALREYSPIDAQSVVSLDKVGMEQ